MGRHLQSSISPSFGIDQYTQDVSDAAIDWSAIYRCHHRISILCPDTWIGRKLGRRQKDFRCGISINEPANVWKGLK
jgi:hypothetical protein